MLMNLKAALAARKLRQLDLALELKISPSVLSEIVHGHRKPEPPVAARIAEILNADQDWLFNSRCVIPAPAVTSREQSHAPAMTADAASTSGRAARD